MRTLIVTLPPPAEGTPAEYDYVLSPDGRTVGSAATAPAALLPQPTGAGAEVVAVVPVQALSWHSVELPRGTTPRSPRLRAVLDGLLEDRLLDESDALHFALQPGARSAGPLWVAACDRAWLRQAVQALESAGRPVTRIVPELSPGEPATLHVLGDPERATLVLADTDGVVAWPLATGAATPPAGVPGLPEGLAVFAEPAVAAAAERALQRPVVLQQGTERRLAAAQSGWDLAQFDLASSGRRRAIKKLSTGWAEWLGAPQWRPARWGVALLVLANLAGLNAWAWKERSALEVKRDAIRATLTTTFPQVRVVVDAPVQMEREVAALRQATGAASGRDVETMLAAVAAAVPPGATAAAVEFTGGELRVKGLGAAAAQPALASGLLAQGYAVRTEADSLVLRQEGAR